MSMVALLALAWLAPTVPDGTPEVIRLKVGTEVVVEVLEDGFDEAKGVRARRVDDGALIDIAFDQMVPEDVRRIRGAKGYLSDEPEPLMVEAMRVSLLVGGEELVGVIVEQGTETFKLRRGVQSWELRRSGVREIVPVQIDALEVYDGEELYAQELAQRNPQSALDHYNLALYCESLQLWARVKEHLATVQGLEPGFKTDIIDGKVKRAVLRMDSVEESALLGKAQRFAQREEYDTALGILDTFIKEKPGSNLKPEFEKVRIVIAKQRAKWVKGAAIANFFTYIDRTARSIANEKEIGLKPARQRMELEGSKLAATGVATMLKLKPEEILAIWEDPKRQTASPHYANYGAGTFTLGSIEAVQKGLVKEDPKKPGAEGEKPADDGADPNDFAARIKKILEEKKKAQEEAAKRAKEGPKKPEKRGPEIADVPPTDEEWWKGAGTDERKEYLVAWWADRDPHVIMIKVEARICGACSGAGINRYFDRNGDDKFSPCTRCKSLGIDRILRFH